MKKPRNDVYVKTGKEGKSVRIMRFAKGGVFVAINFNKKREVIGVEILSASTVAIDGILHVPFLTTSSL